MPDWYRDHNYSPEAASESEYRNWAQDNGADVDLAGNVSWPGEHTHLDSRPVSTEEF